jgi:hypothetical protein
MRCCLLPAAGQHQEDLQHVLSLCSHVCMLLTLQQTFKDHSCVHRQHLPSKTATSSLLYDAAAYFY